MRYRKKGRQERGSTREVKTRIPVSEYEEWKKRADMLNITVAEYIRQCVRQGKVVIYVKDYMDISALVEIAGEFGKIGNNFNQIAAHLNSRLPWTKTLLADMEKNLMEMRKTTKALAHITDKINEEPPGLAKKKYIL